MDRMVRWRDVQQLWEWRDGADAEMRRQGARQAQLVAGSVGLALLVGASRQITVQWPETFALPYTASVVPLQLLGSATAAVTGQDADSVTVTVTATGLVTAGAQFLVMAQS